MGGKESRNMVAFTFKETTTFFPTVSEPSVLMVVRDTC